MHTTGIKITNGKFVRMRNVTVTNYSNPIEIGNVESTDLDKINLRTGPTGKPVDIVRSEFKIGVEVSDAEIGKFLADFATKKNGNERLQILKGGIFAKYFTSDLWTDNSVLGFIAKIAESYLSSK